MADFKFTAPKELLAVNRLRHPALISYPEHEEMHHALPFCHR